MDKKLKFAIVGCGGIFRWAHSYIYHGERKSDEIDVVAVCDIKLEKAPAAADLLGISYDHCYADFKEMFDKEEIDAIDICTPNYLHSIVAVEALNRGLHVFCEKPDAVSVEEANKMKDAAEKSGKVLMVMRNNRYNNYSKFLKKYIEDGKMGEIYTARCGWRRRRGIPGKGGWFTDKAQSGGGPLIDLGVHMIDLSMWLMGNPKPVAVSGCTYTKFADNDSGADSEHAKFGEVGDGVFDVEDLAMGFIRFDNGASMQVEFSWASNIEREKNFIELRGTKAGASTDTTDDKFKIFSEENGTIVDIVPSLPNTAKSGHEQNIAHFVDVVKGRAKPDFEPIQGVNMVKILEAMYKSAELGEEVKL